MFPLSDFLKNDFLEWCQCINMLRTDKKNNSYVHGDGKMKTERKGTKPVSVHRKGADSTREKVSRIYKRESENKNCKHNNPYAHLSQLNKLATINIWRPLCCSTPFDRTSWTLWQWWQPTHIWQRMHSLRQSHVGNGEENITYQWQKNKHTQSIIKISADKKGQSRSKTSRQKDDESVTGHMLWRNFLSWMEWNDWLQH